MTNQNIKISLLLEFIWMQFQNAFRYVLSIKFNFTIREFYLRWALPRFPSFSLFRLRGLQSVRETARKVTVSTSNLTSLFLLSLIFTLHEGYWLHPGMTPKDAPEVSPREQTVEEQVWYLSVELIF